MKNAKIWWRSLSHRQRRILLVSSSSILLGFGLLLSFPEKEPEFVCIDEASGRRRVPGGAGMKNVVDVAKKYCTGDVDKAAIALIEVYGVEPLGVGQMVSLPRD